MSSLRLNYRTLLVYLIILFAAWIAFAPVQIGGRVSYVIISGNSMEPHIHLGDLVVARKDTHYEVNQQVVYQHPKLGHVFHRIVEKKGDYFILKGDNNDWLDSHLPTSDEILGKYWFKIPRGGQVIRTLRNPINFTGFVFIISVIAASILFNQKENQPRRYARRRISMDNKLTSPLFEIRQELLFIVGILAIVALILGFISFTRPLMMEVSSSIEYTHQGSFDYTSDEKALVYNSATIKTGDPVYSQLMCAVIVDFDYGFTSSKLTDEDQENLHGSYRIDLNISDADGWNRSYQMVPETEFFGAEFASRVDVNICDMQTLIEDKEVKTGVESNVYDLVILPTVSIEGSISGISFEDTYDPRILFQLESKLMRLPEQEDSDLLQEGSINIKKIIPNVISIFGRYFNVENVRIMAGILLGVALLGSIFPAWSLFRDWQESTASRIDVAQKPLLVSIELDSLKTKGTQVIPVQSFQDLVKLAERYGAMILHESGKDFHRYTVQDGGTLFQYLLKTPPASKEGE